MEDTGIQVGEICDLASLKGLETDWRQLHANDSQATVFTSWPWLWGRLSVLTEPWWVLVARDEIDGPAVGLLPLRMSIEEKAKDTRLILAGSPLADYTGFLCAPGFEDASITALAHHVGERMTWQHLTIRDTFDPRLKTFLGHFPEPNFHIEHRDGVPCPMLELEADWERYLDTRPSPKMRKKIRRELRIFERLPNLRRTTVEEAREEQIETLLQLWQMRWEELPEARLVHYRSVFLSCLADGCLWIDVFWDDDVPIAGLLAFLDQPRSAFCYYISGFDSRYSAYSPGTVLVAHSIREAIRLGYRYYDFLRGDERYKQSFGARTREAAHAVIHRQK